MTQWMSPPHVHNPLSHLAMGWSQRSKAPDVNDIFNKWYSVVLSSEKLSDTFLSLVYSVEGFNHISSDLPVVSVRCTKFKGCFQFELKCSREKLRFSDSCIVYLLGSEMKFGTSSHASLVLLLILFDCNLVTWSLFQGSVESMYLPLCGILFLRLCEPQDRMTVDHADLF